jgi:hypothetical protein
MRKTVQFILDRRESPDEISEPTYVAPDLFQELIERWPECNKEGLPGFRVDYDLDSPVLQEIVQFLTQHGKVPKWTRFPRITGDPKTLYLSGTRVFDPVEIEEAPYCDLFPERPIAGGRFTPDGSVILLTKTIKRKRLGQLRVPTLFVPYCTGELKQMMEREDFSHLEFRPAKLEGTRPPADGIWQMWSDLKMPPMLNRITDNEGADYKPDANKGCTIDDWYHPFQYRYQKAEIEQLGDFDVALTRESFGNYPDKRNTPKMIVSKRFRKWCDAEKLKIQWTPIALE